MEIIFKREAISLRWSFNQIQSFNQRRLFNKMLSFNKRQLYNKRQSFNERQSFDTMDRALTLIWMRRSQNSCLARGPLVWTIVLSLSKSFLPMTVCRPPSSRRSSSLNHRAFAVEKARMCRSCLYTVSILIHSYYYLQGL